jgi:hypothetical protein
VTFGALDDRSGMTKLPHYIHLENNNSFRAADEPKI